MTRAHRSNSHFVEHLSVWQGGIKLDSTLNLAIYHIGNACSVIILRWHTLEFKLLTDKVDSITFPLFVEVVNSELISCVCEGGHSLPTLLYHSMLTSPVGLPSMLKLHWSLRPLGYGLQLRLFGGCSLYWY